ncbi:CRAL-TRIO domain-containing protein [Mycena chlorophos]|uniref:Phosphatidylinositol transfer protein SFH5 n=1 Tax=Mycena chlorophos TaxID=658473 RepID=A0A8H6W9S2_MYCCL|nr:CRAL-TRIO domain-containing protein [Mycena chlorophos]
MSDTTPAAPAVPEPTPAPVVSDSVIVETPVTATEAPATTTSEAAAPQPGATATVPTPTAAPVTEKAKTESTVEEPQNALTEAFTGSEWKALKEFKKLIPDALVKAYEKPEAKTTAITLWGVPIDPTNLSADARTSVVLMKFLRARNLNPSAANEMFIATLRWRDEFKVDDACKEEFPQDVFGKLGHIYGKDKDGRPVVYNVYGGNSDINAVFGDVERFLRWRVAFMEKSLLLLDFVTVDQCIQVHDYEGVSMTSRTPESKKAASEASSIFGSHYPELLYKKFFVNVPGYMSWIFWIFKTIMPAATFGKLTMVGTGSSSIGKALLPFIAADQLPKRYGGTAEAAVFDN